MRHSRINCAFYKAQGRPFPAVETGDVLAESNLAQVTAGTVIYPGVKNLTLENCNIVNVKLEPTWENLGGNNYQKTITLTDIFPTVEILQDQKLREHIKKATIDKYTAKADQLMDAVVNATTLDPAAFEASVIAAMSVKKASS